MRKLMISCLLLGLSTGALANEVKPGFTCVFALNVKNETSQVIQVKDGFVITQTNDLSPGESFGMAKNFSFVEIIVPDARLGTSLSLSVSR